MGDRYPALKSARPPWRARATHARATSGQLRSLAGTHSPAAWTNIRAVLGSGSTAELPSWWSVLLAARLSQPRPKGWQLSRRRTGEDQGTLVSAGRTRVRRAISVPLTPVTRGLSRSLTDAPHRRSGHVKAETAQLPKLIVRVRFPSPQLQR